MSDLPTIALTFILLGLGFAFGYWWRGAPKIGEIKNRKQVRNG